MGDLINPIVAGGGGGGGNVQMATGTYDGNGADDRTIVTGLTAPIKQLWITARTTDVDEALGEYHKNDTMEADDMFKRAETGVYTLYPQGFIQFSGNDFEVSADIGMVIQGPNVTLHTYYWTAFA